ncbi:MAG: hypothetical protein ACOC8P_00450 [Dichotomicrobium sp.]
MSNETVGAWEPIKNAPRDGRPILVAWIVNGRIENGPLATRWEGDHWQDYYTPTHWFNPEKEQDDAH